MSHQLSKEPILSLNQSQHRYFWLKNHCIRNSMSTATNWRLGIHLFYSDAISRLLSISKLDIIKAWKRFDTLTVQENWEIPNIFLDESSHLGRSWGSFASLGSTWSHGRGRGGREIRQDDGMFTSGRTFLAHRWQVASYEHATWIQAWAPCVLFGSLYSFNLINP